MLCWHFVSLILVAGLFKLGLALKCMECVDIPKPSFCAKVTTCPTDSQCQLTQYITSAGAVLYSSGCVSNATCGYLSQADSVEDASLDLTVCKDCCNDRDFCNNEGCGQLGTPLGQRGPYCYKCSVEDEQYGCRTITQCDLHELCYLEKGSFPGTYKSGCKKNTNCTIASGSTQHKRMLNVTLPICCTEDFCNDIVEFVDNSPQPVNGSWSSWSNWSGCSKTTCGTSGTRLRNRVCDNPPPKYNGHDCVGDMFDVQDCIYDACRVDGSWSTWGNWSDCSETCGATAVRARTRQCDNSAPQHNGTACVGKSYEIVSCNFTYCPINGSWSSWQEWSKCSHTCGWSSRNRHRTCDNPIPKYGGLPCEGKDHEMDVCTVPFSCPVNGGWSVWSSWSKCSSTCGYNSLRTRTRACDNPKPQYNGLECPGNTNETESCHVPTCTVTPSGWSEWSYWSSCSASCGPGHKTRYRHCLDTVHNTGCDHQSHDSVSCELAVCPGLSGWSAWSEWGKCVGPCGKTRHYRKRYCNQNHCGGAADEWEHCQNPYHCNDHRCKTSDGFEVVMVGSKRLCLYLSQGAYQWSVANYRCKHYMGGNGLVSIANKDVDDAIRTFLDGRLVPCHNCQDESHSYTWFGLHDLMNNYGQYYHNWLNPNIAFGYHDFHQHYGPRYNHCGVGGGELYEKWYSEKCNYYYNYLCEIIL